MKAASTRTLKWAGITVGSLVVAIVLALTFMDWNLLKAPLERIATARSGHSVSIAGNLGVRIWTLRPRIIVEGLTVGNPPGESGRPMATLDRLEVEIELLPLLRGQVILPRLALTHPDVYLHQDLKGRANWSAENQAPSYRTASQPAHLPVIRDFIIEGGRISVLDERRKLKIDGSIEAHEHGAQTDPQAFKIEGKGTINDQPFEMQVDGGPLVNLDPKHPYPFGLMIRAGDIEVQADGQVLKPFDLAGLDFNVGLKGKDLAEGYYLTQLALPNTAPFDLRAHIERRGQDIAVTKIDGKVGESDLGGHLDIDLSRKRPDMSGELVSKQLRMADLAASLGSKQGNGTLDEKTAQQAVRRQRNRPSAPPAPDNNLFPDAHLQVDRVRAMDADVRFRAQSIVAGAVPFKAVLLHVKLEDGLLTLDPFSLEMPQGRLAGEARIDARQDVPKVHIDARMKDIELSQLKSKAPGASAPLDGELEARMVLDGSGDSLHQVVSDANGTFTAILPGGQVNAAFPELTGINVAEGLGLLLSGSNNKSPIRCGLAQFDIKNGVMAAQNITFDTQNVLIKGTGDIRLGPEELNLEVKGEPKKLRLTRLRTPIEVRGHLMKPDIGVNVASTVKQGAVAVALGVLVTPLAAVLAFVDPGLAKDQNCAALIQDAEHKGPAVPRSSATPGSAPAARPGH